MLFDVRPAVAYLNDRQSGQQVGGQKVFVGENPARGAALNYYLPAGTPATSKLTIADATGRVIRTLDGHEEHRHQPSDVEPGGRPATREAAGGGGGRGGFGGNQAGRSGNLRRPRSRSTARRSTKPVVVLQDVWLREK